MKIFVSHRIPWHIFACHILLAYLVIQFAGEAEAKLGHVGWAKSDSRTKQLLQNIRSRIAAQQAEEQQQQQEKCDPRLPGCRITHGSDGDDSGERSSPVEVIPPLRFRARQKTSAQLKKDIGHAIALKDRKSTDKKKENDEDVDKKPKKEDEGRKRVKETKPIQDKKVKVEEESEEKKPKKDEEKKRVKETKPIQDKKVKIEEESEEKKPKKDEEKKRVKETKPIQDKKVKIEEESEEKKPKPKLKVDAKQQPDKKDEKIETKPAKRVDVKMKEPKIEPAKTKRVTQKPQEKPAVTLKREKRQEKKEETPKRFPDDVPVFSLNSDSVQSEECKKHSRVYLRQLQRYKMWALMMYDATAKLPSGILQGNTNQYGDFDQCLSVNATFKKKGKNGIEGKYCLATIDISTDSTDPGLQHAIHRSQSFNFVKSKITDPGHFIPRFSTVNWGLCIPSVCKAEDLENSIKSTLTGYKKSSGLTFDVKVEERNCVTKRNLLSDYDVKTFITLSFYVAVVAVAIFATFNDRNRKSVNHKPRTSELNPHDSEGIAEQSPNLTKISHGKLKALLMAFSLKRNVKKLFIEGESEDSINCIHGIKSIFTMMLYFAHKTIPLALTPFSNRVALTEISNEVSSVLLRGSMIYTDSFLLISGVLTSFNLCKDLMKTGRILWIRRTISRYIRLTPALLATLLFYAYVSDSLGSGPIWNVTVKENAVLCQRYMWRNLFYIQNFYQFEEMCAPQTHQLALDMQLFLLSPLLVHCLHKYDKLGIGILQALLMASAILRFTTTINHELSLVIYHGMPLSQMYKTANYVYAQAVYRATPYIIGVIVGFYLQKVGKNYKLPKAAVIIGWITSICLGLSSLVAPLGLAKRDYVYDSSRAAQYAALSPIAWSAALGWIIAACHFGHGGKLNEYLSCRIFLIFSRISYSVYLVQFLVFSYVVGSKRIPEMFSVLGSLDVTEFVVVIIISIVMTLLFDIPTVEIKTFVLSLLPDAKKGEGKVEEVKETPAEEEKKEAIEEEIVRGEGGDEDEVPTVKPDQQIVETVEIRDENDGGVEHKLLEDEVEYEEEYEDEEEEEEEEDDPEDLDYDRLEDEYEEEEAEDVAEDLNEEISPPSRSNPEEEEVDFWADKPDGD